MPEPTEAVEAIARKIPVALAAADLEAFSHLLDPHVHWGAPDDPSPGCQSRREVLAWYRRGKAAGVRAQVSDVEVIGDRIVVGLTVTANEAAREGSGAVQRWQVLTVRGGLVVDIVGFDSRDDAVAHVRWHQARRPA